MNNTNTPNSIGLMGPGSQSMNVPFSQFAPVPAATQESVTNVISECLAAIHDLNGRLGNTADRISGPEPQSPNAPKESGQPNADESLLCAAH